MAGKKEWTKEDVVKLISVYEEKPILWDTKCVDYRNREKRQSVFQEFSAEFHCTSEGVQRKLHNLRNQMSQEIKKIKKKKSGTGTDEIYISSWPYFSALKFFLPALTPNQSMSTHTSFPQTIESVEVESQFEELVSETVSSEVEGHEQNNEEKRKDRVSAKKRKRNTNDDTSDDKLFNVALETLQKPLDDDDRFGQYIAVELLGLRSDFYKRRLKSEIRKSVVRICDEEEMHYASSSSSVSTPMPSPGFCEPVVDNHAQQGSSSSCATYYHSFAAL